MKNKHLTTRIFFGLFIITMLLTYVALTLTERHNSALLNADPFKNTTDVKQSNTNQVPSPEEKIVLLPTTDWKVYKDKTYPISFSYPKNWTVQSGPALEKGFYDITIKPNDKSPNFHISISKESYLGMDGLNLEPYTIGEIQGQSVNKDLVIIKTGEYYYTFDGSLNVKKLPEFTTLLSTVVFQ